MRMPKEINLVTIINKWLKQDPLLKKHINFEPEGPSGSGELLGTCYPKNRVQYAIGYVLTAEKGPLVYVWRWKPFWPGKRKAGEVQFSRGAHEEVILYPGDPQFFEKLKVELLRAHDSLSPYHKCKKIWNTSVAPRVR